MHIFVCQANSVTSLSGENLQGISYLQRKAEFKKKSLNWIIKISVVNLFTCDYFVVSNNTMPTGVGNLNYLNKR